MHSQVKRVAKKTIQRGVRKQSSVIEMLGCILKK